MADPQQTFPRILKAYTALFQALLPGILFYLYRAEPTGAFAVERLFPSPPDGLALACYAVGFAAFAASFALPGALARNASAPTELRLPLPGAKAADPRGKLMLAYMIRLALLEACSLAGFALGMMKTDPSLSLPLAALGLVGVLLARVPETPAAGAAGVP